MVEKKLKKVVIVILLTTFSLFGFDYEEGKRELMEFYSLEQDPNVDVVIIKNDKDIPQEVAQLPQYFSGVAIPEMNKIYIFENRTGNYPFKSIYQVYLHELSHIYLYKKLGFHPPRWFDEGVAMYISKEDNFDYNFYLLSAQIDYFFSDKGLDNIEKNFLSYESQSKQSYAISKSFIKDIFKSREDLQNFIELSKREKSIEIAFLKKFSLPPEIYFKHWLKKLPFWHPIVIFFTFPNNLFYLAIILLIIAFIIRFKERKKWKRRWEEDENWKYIQ